MNDKKPEDGWSKITKWIAGLTGVLIILPSLINSGKDIMDVINKTPRTDSERINVAFFKKYWGAKPVRELPLLIKRGDASYQVNFYVYDEGDIFVQYGNMTQWFAFPSQSILPTAINTIISNAYADGAAYRQIDGQFSQKDSFQGGNAIRYKTYANGINERQVIDMRTGIIIDQSISQDAPSLQPPPQIPQSIKIDLDSPRPTFEFIH